MGWLAGAIVFCFYNYSPLRVSRTDVSGEMALLSQYKRLTLTVVCPLYPSENLRQPLKNHEGDNQKEHKN